MRELLIALGGEQSAALFAAQVKELLLRRDKKQVENEVRRDVLIVVNLKNCHVSFDDKHCLIRII